ncbi:hypothetical protein [Aquabacterium sp.]|uniref:hypothetical protein n=1 Tax=Aquabacterium sp. TaxID=1872578 RepID=UPI0035ADF04A
MVETARRRTQPAHHAHAGIWRLVLMAWVAISLFSGIIGGLLRAGVSLPPLLASSAWGGQAVALHAALMMCGFFGTVIGVERAVALRRPWAFAAPLLTAGAAGAWLTGHVTLGTTAALLASGMFAVVNAAIVRKQAATHTWLLLIAGGMWGVGNLCFAWLGLQDVTVASWFSFLTLTIAAERLEMSRLLKRPAWASPLLMLIVAMQVLSVITTLYDPRQGGVAFGLSLVALAGWLGCFDIARQTVRAHGLSRYMAICLLGGYIWLLAAGLSWMTYANGSPTRDAALHGLGLGFIVSMVMGHAPVILPAVAGIKLHFDRRFYVPLLALHLSLLWRLGGGALRPEWKAMGATLNALSLLLFALTVASAAWSWQQRHPR